MVVQGLRSGSWRRFHCGRFGVVAVVLALCVGLLASALPVLGLSVAEAQDASGGEVVVEPGAPPLEVPVYVPQPILEPPAPQEITLEMSFGASESVSASASASVQAAAAAGSAAAAADPTGAGFPVQVSPKGRVVQDQPLQLSATSAANAPGAQIEFTIGLVSVDPPTGVEVDSTCNAKAAVWNAFAGSDAWVNVPAARVAEEGYYVWCARTQGATSWSLEFVQVASQAKLGLLGHNLNHANVKGVNVATGNWVVSRTDVSIPTIGPELAVHRVYNSASAIPGAFGEGWTFNYDIRLNRVGVGGNPGGFVLQHADGAATEFVAAASGNGAPVKWQPAAGTGETETLVSVADGYLLEHRDGGSHLFDAGSGRLIEIRDAWGNKLELTYYNNGRLRTVADVRSGRELAFVWQNGKISTVTAPDPREESGGAVVWSYRYGPELGANADRLSSVCEPRAALIANRPIAICEGYRWDNEGDSAANRMDGIFNHVRGTSAILVSEVNYDGSGRVLTFTERPATSVAHSTTFEYAPVGNLLSQNLWHWVCSTNEELAVEVRPCTAGIAENGASNRWSYRFNTKGQFYAMNPFGSGSTPTRYYYDDAGRRYRIEDPLCDEATTCVEHSTELFFDDDGDLVAERNGAGEYSYYGYDDDHNMTASCDHRAGNPLGTRFANLARANFCELMEYTNGSLTKRTTTINPGNTAVETWVRDSATGVVKEFHSPTTFEQPFERDRNNEPIVVGTFDRTKYTYDEQWNLVGEEVGSYSSDDPDDITSSGLEVRFEHNSWGQTTRTEFLRGSDNRWVETSLVELGPTGLITKTLGPLVTNPVTQVARRLRTATTYTPQGQPYQVTESSVNWNEAIHDRNLDRTTTYGYDILGRETAVRDAAGHTTRRYFDKVGNVEQVCDARRSCLKTTYGRDNLPDSVIAIDLNGEGDANVADIVIKRFDHDAAGRLVTDETVDGATVVFEYDGADRVIRELIEDFDGEVGNSRRLNEYIYAGLGDDNYAGTGFLLRHLEGGRYNPELSNDNGQPRVGVFLTTEFDYTLSGLVKQQRVGTHRPHPELELTAEQLAQRFKNWIITDYAYASSGRVTRETTSRNLGDDQSRMLWNYEFGKVSRTEEAKYLGRTVDNIFTDYDHDERGNLIATTTYKRKLTPEDDAAFIDEPITTNYAVDSAGRTFLITAPRVQVFTRSTDGFGVAIAPATQAAVRRPTSKIGYNAWGEITHEEDANNNTTVTTRDLLGRPNVITHPAYDNPLDSAGADAPTEGFDYDENGNLTKYTSRRGYYTYYAFDDFNQVTIETAPYVSLGDQPTTAQLKARSHASFDYDLAGNMERTKDKAGAVTNYEHNGYGLVIEEEIEGGVRNVGGVSYDLVSQTTTYTYDSGGHLASTSIGNSTVAQKWNSAGELAKVSDADGASWSYTYDNLGNPLTVTDPEDHKTRYCYDGRGDLEITKFYGPSKNPNAADVDNCDVGAERDSPRELQWMTQTRFDRAGRVKATYDAAGVRTSYGYDDLGRLSYVIMPSEDGDEASPERPWTRFGYDAAGNLKIQVDGRGKVTRFTYNPWNLQETTTEPGSNTWTIGYDGGGLATDTKDPTHATITRTFTEAGLLHTETADGVTRTFGYDGERRQTSAKLTGSAAQKFHYDSRGALFLSTGPMGDTELGYYADTEDNAGLLEERTDPASDTAHTFKWNNQRELASHVDPIAGKRSYTYNDLGQVLSARSVEGQGNNKGYFQQYSYDDAGRVKAEEARFTSSRGVETSVRDAAYTWTANGDLKTKETKTREPGGPGERAVVIVAQAEQFDYDGARRLTEWSITEGETNHTETYDYDKAGNRVSLVADSSGDETTKTWTYDASNRIKTGPGDATYTWNADGTLNKIDRGDGDIERFTFDDFHQLTGTKFPDQSEVDYDYDALGRLAERSQNGAANAFTYPGHSIEPTTYSNGTAAGTINYSRGLGGDLLAYNYRNSNGALQNIDVDLNLHGDVSHERYVQQNQLKVNSARTPFGEPLANLSSGVGQSNLGFQGDFTDPVTGDVNMGARWYTPNSGTFRSRDSYPGELRTPISLNRYTYANNNPATYWDPTGYMSSDRFLEANDVSTEEIAKIRKSEKAKSTGSRSSKTRKTGAGNVNTAIGGNGESAAFNNVNGNVQAATTVQVERPRTTQPATVEAVPAEIAVVAEQQVDEPLVLLEEVAVASFLLDVCAAADCGTVDYNQVNQLRLDAVHAFQEADGCARIVANHGPIRHSGINCSEQMSTMEALTFYATVAGMFPVIGDGVDAIWCVGEGVALAAGPGSVGGVTSACAAVAIPIVPAAAGRGAKLLNSKRILNVGSGSNPLPGATNLDLLPGSGVNVVGDAGGLPFGSASFDEVVALNPYDYQAVSAETARVLGPGGTLRVTGAPQNAFIGASDEAVKAAGFEVIYRGPARSGDIFGSMSRTDGSLIANSADYSTVIYQVSG